MTAGAELWDCHAHAFGPPSLFPPIAERGYDPPVAPPADFVRAAAAQGAGHIVWVQPSIYGADNSALLATLGPGSPAIRGIIAPPARADTAELHDLHARGVRGMRLNLVSKGGNGLASLAPFRAALPGLGWHVAAFADATVPGLLEEILAAVEVPVVLDHFGWPGGRPPPGPAAFLPMLRLMETGRLWVKLSAPYLLCDGAPGCPAAAALTGELIRANPERVLFGSNWPHIGSRGRVALCDLIARTADWIAEAGASKERIFMLNAAALYK